MSSQQDILLEQYKLYVEMADRVSKRRGQTNRFYVSILSGLIALLSIISSIKSVDELKFVIFAVVSLLAILLNFLWIVNIRSYRQLNTQKFKVLQSIEERLPFACYKKEWLKLHSNNNYLELTRVEKFVPILLLLPYLTLFIYSLCKI